MLTLVRRAAALGLVTVLSAACSAQSADSPAAVFEVANATLQAIDQGKGASLYSSSPSFVRNMLKQDDFVNGIVRERAKLAAGVTRTWATVERVLIQPGASNMPAGTVCANLVYSASAGAVVVGAERVSLCQEGGKWLPTGYQAGAVAPSTSGSAWKDLSSTTKP